MKIYLVCGGWDYEGMEVLKAFNEVKDAERFQDEFIECERNGRSYFKHVNNDPFMEYDFLDITEMELE